jgi:putative DNA primase/helicase
LDDREIKGALHHFQDLVAKPEFFASAPKGLCFADKFLLLDGSRVVAVEHSPNHGARHAYSFDYDPNAPCPLWHQYLESVWSPDEDRVEKSMLLAEFMGAALFACAPRFKAALMLVGEADTGKSTLLSVICGLFPSGTVCSVALHEMEQEYRRAYIAGKLINIVAEVPSAELIRSEAFKALISGDQVQGRHIRQDVFDFVPVAAHVFAANTLPHVSDRSEGVWTRWHVLSFNRRFLRSKTDDAFGKADVNLATRILETEIPGIVAWSVAGFERLLLNSGEFTRPPSSAKTLQEWRRESDPVALFFDAELELDANSVMSSSSLYEGYREWCTQNGFMKPLSHITFSKSFGKLLRERTKLQDVTRMLHGKTQYLGVRVRDEVEFNTAADFSELIQ